MLVYADFFMLDRLVEICSSLLIQFVRANNVLQIWLVAHAFNAGQLERYCLHYMVCNEDKIKGNGTWVDFENKVKPCLLQKV